MIKFIVKRYTSKPDIYGNRYSLVEVIETATEKTTVINTGWGDGKNVIHYLRNAGLEWNELSDSETEMPIREFNRFVKRFPEAIGETAFQESLTTQKP